MAEDRLYQMIYKLAEQGLGRSLGGEGTPTSRAVGLILSAVDQLSTAATLDQAMSGSIQQAIDVLRQKVEEQSGGQRQSQQPDPFTQKQTFSKNEKPSGSKEKKTFPPQKDQKEDSNKGDLKEDEENNG